MYTHAAYKHATGTHKHTNLHNMFYGSTIDDHPEMVKEMCPDVFHRKCQLVMDREVNSSGIGYRVVIFE